MILDAYMVGVGDRGLKGLACTLANREDMAPFKESGGLSLQIGHRMSIDIDLFTDQAYGSIDFNAIDDYLRNTFSNVSRQSFPK